MSGGYQPLIPRNPMPTKFTTLNETLHRYAVEHSDGQDEILRRLAQETEERFKDRAIMQIAPEQGALITLLVRAIEARRAIELGTFTGYSAICIARGLPDDGLLVTCDVDEDATAIARRYFEQAWVDDKIDLRLGPGLDTLRGLTEDESFDFAFIDADKPNYPHYYEECMRLLRPGGLIMVDNVFYDGFAPDADQSGLDESYHASRDAIRELNDRIAADNRVHAAMIAVGDGITLALKL
jgi:predicted O-methyltransferase YrrM